ncbi:hypothetical protein G7077_03260 [Sphingomonas piscis]|uniref:Uncharacterized protein n=1 Tax=Sphingomonas piscis TaxID=2714943 RepID=A0A6G7YMY0_9SPHN|nr:hypothetical protein [Sphingomonas piscis]QIK78076.1 hypothetical protein G7077_03260 [Sphingomonas piscis]
MAKIVRDPLVADYIVEHDVKTEADCSEVRRLYEEGCLVLLRDVRFDLDYPFLNSLNFDVEGPADIMQRVKKYGGHKILALTPKNTGPLDQFVFQNVFGSDAGKLSYFQEQVRSGNAQSDALYARLFPNYVSTRAMYTWRFTETMYEDLHWDVFGIEEHFHQVRIFSNLAASPRLWRVSHRSDEFAERVYRDAELRRFAGSNGDDLLRAMNKSALYSKTPCLDRQPKHHIAFAQGDVWVCETRIVAHQIYHGERAFAAMYFSEATTMDRPELAFEARIKRVHDRLASGETSAPLEPAI